MEDELFKLSQALGALLKKRHEKIATAESCTGGGIAQVITEVAGSSAWFDRGFVTYSNNAKIQMLGIKPETLEKFGAVSRETALEMVQGALAHSDADCALAVTGVAGPDGGSAEKPVGTVFIAWAHKNKTARATRHQFVGDRHSIRVQTIKMALQGVFE